MLKKASNQADNITIFWSHLLPKMSLSVAIEVRYIGYKCFINCIKSDNKCLVDIIQGFVYHFWPILIDFCKIFSWISLQEFRRDIPDSFWTWPSIGIKKQTDAIRNSVQEAILY